MIDPTSWTFLHYGAILNSIEICQKALDYGVDINLQDVNGYTALHGACEKNNGSIVKLLLDNKASVSLKDAWGNTPIRRGAINLLYSGFVNEYFYLLDKGADIYEENNYGINAAVNLDNTAASEKTMRHFIQEYEKLRGKKILRD